MLPQITIPVDSLLKDGRKVYLKHILSTRKYKGQIPNKVILNKTLPGWGATSCEIESERHSIIIEPNVPVIDGKAKDYPNKRWDYEVLGVRKGIEVQDIIDYLNREVVIYKKILTTPESFWKVKKALNLKKI